MPVALVSGGMATAEDTGNDDSKEYDCPVCDDSFHSEALRDAHESGHESDAADSQNVADDNEDETEAEAETTQWADQESYNDKTRDLETVELPDGGQKMRVYVIPPMKFASLAEEHDISQYTQNLEEVDDTAGVQDNLDEALATVKFYQEIVVPNIDRPKNAHWDNPPEDPEATEVFDLSTLTADDLMAVVAAVIAEDAEELSQDARKNARAANRGS